MTANNTTTSQINSNAGKDLVFMILVGVFLGLLGGLMNEAALSIVGSVLLLSLFGSFNSIISRNRGLVSGLIAGGAIGVVVGEIGFLLGDIPSSILDATLFGLVRGLLVGAIVGFITRAKPDEQDGQGVALFLTAGSIVVGGLLGAGVGAVVGLLIGIIQYDWWGALLALILGCVVGRYMGEYFKTRRAIIAGAVIFGLLGLSSTLIGGAFAGLVLGMISGALTPMMVVSAISAWGGLSSRGFKAMVIEAAEAPAEMVAQGAVPFLAPAILVGIIVGTSTVGADGVIVLAVAMAMIGMLLGVIAGVEKRAANKVTVRQLIEMVMLGADEWPLAEVFGFLSGPNRHTAVRGAIIGLLIGLLSAAAGAFLGLQITLLWQQFI
jgi:hypothetical protein